MARGTPVAPSDGHTRKHRTQARRTTTNNRSVSPAGPPSSLRSPNRSEQTDRHGHRSNLNSSQQSFAHFTQTSPMHPRLRVIYRGAPLQRSRRDARAEGNVSDTCQSLLICPRRHREVIILGRAVLISIGVSRSSFKEHGGWEA